MQLTKVVDNAVPTLDQQINDIMCRFNFGRVLTVMHAINWRWRGQVVEINDLKRTAVYLMDHAVQSYHTNRAWSSTSTGGFTARVDHYGAGVRLSLAFSVEDVDAYMD